MTREEDEILAAIDSLDNEVQLLNDKIGELNDELEKMTDVAIVVAVHLAAFLDADSWDELPEEMKKIRVEHILNYATLEVEHERGKDGYKTREDSNRRFS